MDMDLLVKRMAMGIALGIFIIAGIVYKMNEGKQVPILDPYARGIMVAGKQ